MPLYTTFLRCCTRALMQLDRGLRGRALAIFGACMLALPASGEEPSPAKQAAERLGRGVNMGNMLEAPREGEWGLMLKEEWFPKIADAGFQSVRIPVRWSAHTAEEPPYLIDPAFLARVDRAVTASLDAGLHTVLNMHHFDELYGDVRGQRARFLAIWRQLAAHFRQHDQRLLFELLNEPRDQLAGEHWNKLLAEAVAEIRQTNPHRILVIGPSDWNSIAGLESLQLPDDERIIATFHYYLPFRFTHQGASWVEGSDAWLGTPWTGTQQERRAIEEDFRRAVTWAQQQRVPIYLGEFGAYSRADQESRERWTHFVRSTAEDHQLPWAYWEFASGFGVYDPQAKSWRSGLLKALIPD